jgi:hypothetical protein
VNAKNEETTSAGAIKTLAGSANITERAIMWTAQTGGCMSIHCGWREISAARRVLTFLTLSGAFFTLAPASSQRPPDVAAELTAVAPVMKCPELRQERLTK